MNGGLGRTGDGFQAAVEHGEAELLNPVLPAQLGAVAAQVRGRDPADLQGCGRAGLDGDTRLEAAPGHRAQVGIITDCP